MIAGRGHLTRTAPGVYEGEVPYFTLPHRLRITQVGTGEAATFLAVYEAPTPQTAVRPAEDEGREGAG